MYVSARYVCASLFVVSFVSLSACLHFTPVCVSLSFHPFVDLSVYLRMPAGMHFCLSGHPCLCLCVTIPPVPFIYLHADVNSFLYHS